MLGPDADEAQEIKFLGRKIRYTQDGLEWEGDDRHVKAFLEKMGVEEGIAVKTPGVKSDKEPESSTLMSAEQATTYRGLVALLNFVSQDRVD